MLFIFDYETTKKFYYRDKLDKLYRLANKDLEVYIKHRRDRGLEFKFNSKTLLELERLITIDSREKSIGMLQLTNYYDKLPTETYSHIIHNFLASYKFNNTCLNILEEEINKNSQLYKFYIHNKQRYIDFIQLNDLRNTLMNFCNINDYWFGAHLIKVLSSSISKTLYKYVDHIFSTIPTHRELYKYLDLSYTNGEIVYANMFKHNTEIYDINEFRNAMSYLVSQMSYNELLKINSKEFLGVNDIDISQFNRDNYDLAIQQLKKQLDIDETLVKSACKV
jgi:hypothetical protein